MLTYIDKFNKPITRDQWFRKFCDKNYGTIKEYDLDDRIVEVFWMGLISEVDNNPWGVYIKPHTQKANRNCYFFATKADALSYAEIYVKNFCQ